MKTQEQTAAHKLALDAKKKATTGLILSGGGARAAYQVGVLSAIADLLPEYADNPFEVIVGTSAGAINAVSLACGALDFQQSIRKLTAIWQNFRSELVYRTDWWGVLRQASRFVGQHLLGFGRGLEPIALLDNSPLRELLLKELDFSGINLAVARRKLRAVAITAFAYQSGQAVTFYQGRGNIEPWERHRRHGLPARLHIEHLMASSAIPLLFPPVRLNHQYFGDGAVRQAAPISPALHLGADRVLVIGVRSQNQEEQTIPMTTRPPSLAQIGGQLAIQQQQVSSNQQMLDRMTPLAAKGYVSGLQIQQQRATALNAQAQYKTLMRQQLDTQQQIDATQQQLAQLPLDVAGKVNDTQRQIATVLGYQDAMSKKAELSAFLGIDPA